MRPAVRLDPLQQMVSLEALSDEDMVNAQRINLLDASAPNPSVETLLHAFLPHKFIDHTHSNAVLALTDQEDGDELCRDLWGDRFAMCPTSCRASRSARRPCRSFARTPR